MSVLRFTTPFAFAGQFGEFLNTYGIGVVPREVNLGEIVFAPPKSAQLPLEHLIHVPARIGADRFIGHGKMSGVLLTQSRIVQAHADAAARGADGVNKSDIVVPIPPAGRVPEDLSKTLLMALFSSRGIDWESTDSTATLFHSASDGFRDLGLFISAALTVEFAADAYDIFISQQGDTSQEDLIRWNAVAVSYRGLAGGLWFQAAKKNATDDEALLVAIARGLWNSRQSGNKDNYRALLRASSRRKALVRKEYLSAAEDVVRLAYTHVEDDDPSGEDYLFAATHLGSAMTLLGKAPYREDMIAEAEELKVAAEKLGNRR